MTWQTANRIQSPQRLNDDIIKQHLAETLKNFTLFQVFINDGGKAIFSFINLSRNNHLDGFQGPTGGLADRWVVGKKSASAQLGDCIGTLSKEEKQIVHMRDLEPFLSHFSAFMVKIISFSYNHL